AGKDTQAGNLILTDGRLLAFPVRSLQAPFLWVTCPLVVARWGRDRRALGLPESTLPEIPVEHLAAFAGPLPDENGLVLEDHYFGKDQVAWANQKVQNLANQWARLLPAGESETRKAFGQKLALIPDPTFQDLVRRGTPINARIQLTGGKTTDRWTDPDTGNEERGNLWYEETLPPDCLFSVLTTSRRRQETDITALRELLQDEHHCAIQIGGNETVGQGLCWWRPAENENGN
ncbi:MAG: type III-B CRISPR module RAMP protein Cmr4, partial [Salinisphaera sp.]|nr:type III-B CRISPR module RAMP protein Cmr4 [Salinisphaera sp.]